MTTFLAGRNDVSSFVSNGAAVAALLLSDPKPVVKTHLMPRLVKTRTVKVHSVQSRVNLAFYKGKPQIKTFVIVASTICSQIIVQQTLKLPLFATDCYIRIFHSIWDNVTKRNKACRL